MICLCVGGAINDGKGKCVGMLFYEINIFCVTQVKLEFTMTQ